MSDPVWGICGAGGISNDFCLALAHNGSTIGAVAASDLSKAQKFAADFGCAKAYGSYSELAEDPDITIVYIGTVHTRHLDHAVMMLEAGKNVLVEKPMGINTAEVQHMVEKAQEKNVFIMEGFWTRCFPVTRRIREVLENDAVGQPKALMAHFGFSAPDDPNHRLWAKDLGGGGLLDIGCYVLQWATLVYGHERTPEIRATAELSDTEVDKRGAISLRYPEKGTAVLGYHIDAAFHDSAKIICEKGIIHVEEPAHCPTSGKIVVMRDGATEIEELNVPLPELTKDCGGRKMNYGGGGGFVYEVQEVERCLKEGLKESPAFPVKESLKMVEIMDAIRSQIGVSYSQDAREWKQLLSVA